jgi:hypothetical protein
MKLESQSWARVKLTIERKRQKRELATAERLKEIGDRTFPSWTQEDLYKAQCGRVIRHWIRFVTV